MCCGRNRVVNTTLPGARASQPIVGDRAAIPTFIWEWRSVNGVDKQRFDSEGEARDHIANGNPGTLTVVAS